MLLGVAIVLFIQQSTSQLKEKARTQLPQEIIPVYRYVETCIKQISDKDLAILGHNGGYMEFPLLISKDPTSYISVHPEFDTLKIPYWWHNGQNRIPSNEFIKNELENSMNTKLKLCVNNFTALENQYNIKQLDDMQTEVILSYDDVVYDVLWPLEIRSKDNTTVSNINRFTINKNIRLSKVLELARKIMEQENKESWLEQLTIDLIALDPEIPYTNFEIRCSPRIWFVKKVEDKLKQLLQMNIPLVRISDTNYLPIPEEQEYVKNHYIFHATGDDSYLNMHASLTFDPSWDFNFNVRPNNGMIMTSGTQQGQEVEDVIDMSWLCMQIYHFTYDVKYPVMVTLKDDETDDNKEYTFNFAFPVNINHNIANRQTFSTTSFDFETAPNSEEFCSEKTQNINIQTKNNVTGGMVVGANVSFECLKFKCGYQGTTDYLFGGTYSGVELMLPLCYGGLIQVEAPGYKRAKEIIDTDLMDGKTEIIGLTPIKKIYNYSVVKHDIEYPDLETYLDSDETAVIIISNPNMQHTTYGFYPPDKTEEIIPMTLLADKDYTYSLKIYLMKDDEFSGGYIGEWKPSNAGVKDAENIKFHTVSTIEPIPDSEDLTPYMQEFFMNLPKNSKKMPEPEIMTKR